MRVTEMGNGDNPSQNSTLDLIINKWHEEELLQATVYIRINLFALHENKKQQTSQWNEYNVKYKNSFIGSVTLPVKALLQNAPEIEGLVSLTKPVMKLEQIYNRSMNLDQSKIDIMTYS